MLYCGCRSLQTFSIPGSIFLSFLAGALFGLPLGLFLVASVCFLGNYYKNNVHRLLLSECKTQRVDNNSDDRNNVQHQLTALWTYDCAGNHVITFCVFSFVFQLSTIGATNCYFISFYLGRNTINKLFPDKLAWFGSEVNNSLKHGSSHHTRTRIHTHTHIMQERKMSKVAMSAIIQTTTLSTSVTSINKHFCWQVSKHSSSLLNYVLFLRFTPVIPNWFVNIAAPLFRYLWTPVHFCTLFTVTHASLGLFCSSHCTCHICKCHFIYLFFFLSAFLFGPLL